jgi:predicted MPP superfamily phosphohydrolase
MAPVIPPLQQRITRRRLLQTGLVGAAALAVYAGEVERHWVEVIHTEARLTGLPEAFEGLRVVQLSDIHMDSYTEPFYLRHVVDKVNSLKPDLILLTGDFVSEGPNTHHFAIGAGWQCANILQGLACRKIYASLGNHDVIVGSEAVTEALTANGIQVLNNACLPLERGNSRIWLSGLDDPLTGRPNPELAIPASIRNITNEPVILMCHAPDFADALVNDPVGQTIGLMLSGHTHGGQVRMPFVGPLTLPGLGRKFVHGWFQLGEKSSARPAGMQLYVNRGIGTVGVPFRFDCPPEITVFTLRRA